MKGLLYKEFAGLMSLYKKTLIITGLLYGVMAVVTEADTLMTMAIMLMAIYSVSGLSLDEQSGWNRYARTLPVTDRQVVAAKFAMMGIFVAIAVVYALAIGVIRMLVSGHFFDWVEYLVVIVVVTVLALIMVPFLIMVALEVGLEKARYYMLFFALIVFAVIFAMFQSMTGLLGLSRLFDRIAENPVVSVITILVVTGAVVKFCYEAACSIYSRKEF